MGGVIKVVGVVGWMADGIKEKLLVVVAQIPPSTPRLLLAELSDTAPLDTASPVTSNPARACRLARLSF
jgi:hypothetical protein